MEPPTSRKVEQSQRLQKRAAALIPGGLIRRYGRLARSVAIPDLLCAQRSRMWDADENELIDYVGSWGH